MKKTLFISLLLLLTTNYLQLTTASAQTPVNPNSAEIYQQLKKLNVLGSVLYIAAHPDDENTRLLSYLSKEKLYRTGYLSLTRGDGGQNLIGDEQGVDLGLIRTQELLAARRIDGAEQFFSRAYDFGFSKNSEEALRIWDKEKILSDVVWVIRQFQPDIIITRFPGDERAGHGHHAASAILANEAFTAAADPKRFPEQLKYGVQPWQAKRILWNTFNFSSANTISEDQFKVDAGTYNSLLGKSMGEIASESRSNHKSQGFGVARQRGQAIEYFTTTGGSAPKSDLMDEVNISWNRIQGANNIQQQINQLIKNYDFNNPEKSVKALTTLYSDLQKLSKSYWCNKKLQEVQDLIIACSGIFVEATTDKQYAVQGEKMNLQFFVNKRNSVDAVLQKVTYENVDTALQTTLNTNQNITFNKSQLIAADHATSQPYWLQQPMHAGSFEVNDQQYIGKAENGAAIKATFVFEINGVIFNVHRNVQYKYTDPVKGELYEPANIIAPISVSVFPSVLLNSVKAPTVQIQFKSYISGNNMPVTVVLKQDGNSLFSKDTTLNLETNKTYLWNVLLKNIASDKNAVTITADVKLNNKHYQQYLKNIQYDHIPDITYTYTQQTKVINEQIKVDGKPRVGYIVGAGDKVAAALQQMNYEVTILQEKDLTDERLKNFDAIVTGVRAYNIHEFLSNKYDVLMRFVQNGGNLIVQYNTNSQIGPVKARMSPYSFNIGRTRVTEEDAKVDFLLPNHPVLNYPNKITAADFDGWIQERSIYQAEQLDSHFVMPLGMNDKGEKESNGSLIIAPYGKGNFVYTGLVFFRELPAGVSGTYKLMANLIALKSMDN